MRVGEKRRKNVTESRVEKEEDLRVQLFPHAWFNVTDVYHITLRGDFL